MSQVVLRAPFYSLPITNAITREHSVGHFKMNISLASFSDFPSPLGKIGIFFHDFKNKRLLPDGNHIKYITPPFTKYALYKNYIFLFDDNKPRKEIQKYKWWVIYVQKEKMFKYKISKI